MYLNVNGFYPDICVLTFSNRHDDGSSWTENTDMLINYLWLLSIKILSRTVELLFRNFYSSQSFSPNPMKQPSSTFK